MKRQRISYSKKRKLDEMVYGTNKRQLVYNLDIIDRQNEQYHPYLFF